MNTQANTHGTTGRVVSTGQSKLHNGAALQGAARGEGGWERKEELRSVAECQCLAGRSGERSAARPPVTRCSATATHEGRNWARTGGIRVR